MNSSNREAESTATPEWWTPDLWATAAAAAEFALPNEVCGLIYTTGRGVDMHCFAATATPTSCVASEQDVIDFAFLLERIGGHVLATFHSHPAGIAQLSAKDTVLADWAALHLLLTRNTQSFEPHWFTMNRV